MTTARSNKSSKPPARNQPAGKQPAGNQPAGKQPAGKQPAGKQPAGKQAARKQPAARKTPARKAAATKATATEATATKATAEATARKATAVRTPVGKTGATTPPSVRSDRLTAVRDAVRTPLFAWIAAIVVGQLVVLLDVPVPLLRPIVGAVLLFGLPVLLLTQRWTRRLGNGLLAFLYAFGTAVLSMIVVPLAVNTVLPWLGVDQPLARPALVGVWTVIDVALVLRYRPTALITRVTARRWVATVRQLRFEPAMTLAVVAVVLAVAGAIRLNNGSSGAVAALAHAVAIIAPAWVTLRRGPLRRDVAVLYLASLALLLGTSLRGWSITGHDIQNEYLAFLYTNDSHHWVMSTYPTPYNACLSVNILPSVVSQYLGVSGIFVFKVLMQLLFAIVPVCVYVTARRFVPGRVAALSVLLFIAFPTFYTDMPFLVRQEVAYLFVALVLLTATQDGWSDRRSRVTTYFFAIGVILSHYATTYLLVITLAAGLVGVAGGRVRQRMRRRKATEKPVGPAKAGTDPLDRLAQRSRRAARSRRAQAKQEAKPIRRHGALILLHPLLVVAVALTAWTWSTPLTHSGGHLAETVDTLTSALLSGDALAGSSDLKYSVIFGGGPTEEQRFQVYAYEAAQERKKEPSQQAFVFPRPSRAIALPPVAERQPLPLTTVGRAAQDATGVDIAGANNILRLGMATVIQLVLGFGLLALVFYSRITRRFSREMFWLVLGSIGALASVALVPGLSASYGVLRAFQQTLIFAAPVVAIGLMTLVTPLRRIHRRAAPLAATGIAALVGLTLTGALPAVFGGYDAVLTQANSGAYYEQLYTDDPQLSTAEWLASATRGKGLTNATASDIVNITRLQFYLPRSVTVDSQFLPLQLRTGSYLVLGPQTIDEGTAGVFFTGDVLTYRYPVKAVEQRLDVIYSTPGNRILR